MSLFYIGKKNAWNLVTSFLCIIFNQKHKTLLKAEQTSVKFKIRPQFHKKLTFLLPGSNNNVHIFFFYLKIHWTELEIRSSLIRSSWFDVVVVFVLFVCFLLFVFVALFNDPCQALFLPLLSPSAGDTCVIVRHRFCKLQSKLGPRLLKTNNSS